MTTPESSRLLDAVPAQRHTHQFVLVPSLQQSSRWRHGSLDSQTTHILPALLQQRHEIVDSQHDITDQLILRHAHIANRHTQTQYLLQLELDRALDLRRLRPKILSMRYWRWEFTRLRQTRSKKTRNLLDEGIRRDESIVLARKLLDQFLVLVEFLQVISGHGINTEVFRAIEIVLVAEDAEGHIGSGNGGEFDGAAETLVTLGIVVLEADLEFDGLEEVALLLFERVVQEFLDFLARGGCQCIVDE